MSTDNPFGKWNNTDERIEELNNRLAAWFVCEDDRRPPIFPEIFADALRKLQAKYNAVPVALVAPATSLLEAFEEALDDHDHILENFPEEPSDEEEGL